MTDPEEQPFGSPLDEALREHLRNRLDGQLGRAAAAFRREVAGRPTPRFGRRVLVWGLCAGASLAASVAIVWSAVVHHADERQLTRGEPRGTTTAESAAAMPLGQAMQYETIDEGTVVLENQGPARQLRRSVLQTYEYYDPQQKATVEVTVPEEQTVLVGMQTF